MINLLRIILIIVAGIGLGLVYLWAMLIFGGMS